MNPLTVIRRLVAPAGQHRAAPASPVITRVAACPCRGWDRLSTHTVDAGVMTCQDCSRRTAEVSAVPLEPGARWLVCDAPACGHTTTRHIPAATPRSWACTWCGTTKGDQ
ncbi:hypothetical protein OHU11_30120 [Streptomyces sp. NBC_00257]|uniref:hypothetical protein n=1 Tax=unclassified Streptomyces TaxID=2593676 RepID=UPI0022564299|nr:MULTISPECIES: hypothetical protein [unclassified Streptomyces]MCX5431910.1 hypothetical protein [Streptomyces sp. NBC_00062]